MKLVLIDFMNGKVNGGYCRDVCERILLWNMIGVSGGSSVGIEIVVLEWGILGFRRNFGDIICNNFMLLLLVNLITLIVFLKFTILFVSIS